MYYREYGPFKGVSSSGNSLIQESNFVEDARNVIVDQDKGDLKKRDGVLLSETLTDQPFGIVSRYKESQLGTQDLFIANKRGLTKADLVTNATEALRPFTADLPALQSGDFFSHAIYQNVLYYNYGDFIYKYDGKYHSRAGMKALSVLPKSFYDPPGPPPLADNNYKFLVQIADNENEFACLAEMELNGYDLQSNFALYGFQKGTDDDTDINNQWYLSGSIEPDEDFDRYDTSGDDFTVEINNLNSTHLTVGSKVFIPAVLSDSNVESITKRLTPVLFEIKSINITVIPYSITFKNPNKLWVFWVGDLGNTVIYPYVKIPSSSVYQSAIFSATIGGYALEWNFKIQYLSQVNATVSEISVPYASLGSEWEFPLFPRKALPRCKHISILDGLLFMTCPKVWSQETGAPDEDFDYQTVAWSSENSEDPIETWGNASVIVGDPSEGRCYATVPNNGALVVFKEKAIYPMEYPVQGITTVQKAASSTVGCKHPESIKEINSTLLFYVEKKGVYAYRSGAAGADELTGAFRGFFKNLTGNAKAIVDEANSRYILFISTYAVVFDALTGSWWIWTTPNTDGGLTYFSNRVVGCNSSKQIYSFVSGQLKDSMGSDAAISAYVLSSWFNGGSNEDDKKLRAIRVWALEGTDPIIVSAYKNFRSTVVFTDTIKNESNEVDVAGFLRFESGIRKFKSVAIKLENNTLNEDLKISGWVFDYDELGFEPKNFTDAK